MGKKFITLHMQKKTYKFYSLDIKFVHQKKTRTIPSIPKYCDYDKAMEIDTEESCISSDEMQEAKELI